MKILKQAIVIICCLVIGVGGTITSWADEPDNIRKYLEELNVINTNSFHDEESVCRIEALPVIMKVFNIHEEDVINAGIFFVAPPFADVDYSMVGERDIANKVMSLSDKSYVNVAVGISMIRGYGGDFYPFNKITADETVAIMARFKEHKAVYHDEWYKLESTHQYAQEVGLFLKTDRFYENGSVAVTVEEFETLLYRLINQPAFWYFNDGQYYDFERSKTYADILQGNYPELERKWGRQEEIGVFPDNEQYKEIESEKLYET